MRDIRQVVQGLKPDLMMVMVQISFASVNVLYKLVINDGMNVKVPTAYRLMFAAATTIPLAIFILKVYLITSCIKLRLNLFLVHTKSQDFKFSL